MPPPIGGVEFCSFRKRKKKQPRKTSGISDYLAAYTVKTNNVGTSYFSMRLFKHFKYVFQT